MASPTLNDLHVDTLLTEVSIAYRNEFYVADQVFPLVSVSKQSDIYPKYDKADWFRDEAQRRAPGEEAKRIGYNVDSTNTYFADGFAIGHDIPDEKRAGADDVYKMNLDRAAVEIVTDKMQLRREVKFFTDFFTTSVWGTDKTGGTDFTYWDTFASSVPIQDIHDGAETILQNTGRKANLFLMGYNVWNELQDHPDFLDRVKYSQMGVMTEDLFARIIGVDRVLVARAIYTTGIELSGSESYSFIAGKNALLAYVAPRPSLLTPSAGYTFVWDGGMGGTGPQIISRRRDSARHTDVVEAFGWWDTVAVATDCGYYFSGAVA